MFEQYTYLVYTLVFCVPAAVILWARGDYARRMRRDLTGILLSTAIITLYGSVLWPIAYRWRCWSYSESQILGIQLFGYVFLEDVLWWALVGFLVASFVSLSTQYEAQGRDAVAEGVGWRQEPPS